MFSKTSCVNYTLETIDKEIIGFIAFRNYPTVMRIAPDAWERWLETMYDLPSVSPVDSLFVSYMIWHGWCNPEVFMKSLQMVFEENFYLENVLFFAPRYRDLSEIQNRHNYTRNSTFNFFLGDLRMTFLKYFTIQTQVDENADPYSNVLYCVERSSVLPSVLIREVT